MAGLLDELERRLALERMGARLYEVIRSKVEREGDREVGSPLQAFDRVILQKYSHFRLVTDLMHLVGSDATVDAASAQQHGTTSVIAAAIDPRTTLLQCLEAALLAEMANYDGWQTLLRLLVEEGHERAVDHVKQAIQVEGLHLELVRDWVAKAQARNTIARATTLPEAAFSELETNLPGQ